MISKAKEVMPSSCRIRNILFTHMGIIGNMNKGNNEVTKYITVPFHVGFSTKGGEINYYSGLTSENYGEL